MSIFNFDKVDSKMLNVFISTSIINTKLSEPVDIISLNGELVQLKNM